MSREIHYQHCRNSFFPTVDPTLHYHYFYSDSWSIVNQVIISVQKAWRLTGVVLVWDKRWSTSTIFWEHYAQSSILGYADVINVFDQWFLPPEDTFVLVSGFVTQHFTTRWLLCFSISSTSWIVNLRWETVNWILPVFTSSVYDLVCSVYRPLYRMSFKESLELWGRGVQGRKRVSPHPSPPSATHSLTH